VVYRGPATGAAAFVEMLDQQGVVVAYDPPFETRSTFDNPELDQAAGIISVTAPSGLAVLAVPALLRRRKNSLRARTTATAKTRTSHR